MSLSKPQEHIYHQNKNINHSTPQMKLRRRDPHQLFLAEGYYTLKHDGSDQGLKHFRTMASLNTLHAQSSMNKKYSTIQTENSKASKIENKTQNASRLKKDKKRHQSNKLLGATSDMVNVNSFKHLTTVHYMDTNQIKWAFGLRNHQNPRQQRSASQVPSTYYKTTQSSKIHHETAQIPLRINFNSYKHIIENGQHPSMATFKFQTTLRQIDEQKRKKSPQIVEKQRSFRTIPIKDRHDYPKLLNSQSLKKKTINPQQDLQSAFDGMNNFPSYTDRIVREKNYNNLREHIKKLPRTKINLPSLGWQTSLRSYENSNQNLQKQENTQKIDKNNQK